jgi:hypothetical protein
MLANRFEQAVQRVDDLSSGEELPRQIPARAVQAGLRADGRRRAFDRFAEPQLMSSNGKNVISHGRLQSVDSGWVSSCLVIDKIQD